MLGRESNMAKDTQANLGFEKQLWDAACVLWGSIPAAEYRQIIVGLIFLRYISAAFENTGHAPFISVLICNHL